MFANNNYAKVWKIFPKNEKDQKYTSVQLSTSRKQKDGNYKTDFSGYVRMIGDAEEKAKELEAQDRIKLLKTGVTNFYNKEAKKKSADQFICFDFDFVNEQKQAEANGASDNDFVPLPEDEKLPFED